MNLAAPPLPAHGTPVKTRSVLIVEDNDDAREMLRHLLEMDGHRVRTAADGPAALDAVRAAPPDVALIDIGLPGMDGYELARRIRAERGPRPPRLIAVTGYGLAEDRQRTRDAGFDVHLVKPINYAELGEALRDEPNVERSSTASRPGR